MSEDLKTQGKIQTIPWLNRLSTKMAGGAGITAGILVAIAMTMTFSSTEEAMLKVEDRHVESVAGLFASSTRAAVALGDSELVGTMVRDLGQSVPGLATVTV
ncbi:MAG TPA: hypothetical protein DIU15_15670, partial [Deltaproteobacteria bacterium]|nr:hypothetical protein [Deltaproteobacteria bacterium]